MASSSPVGLVFLLPFFFSSSLFSLAFSLSGASVELLHRDSLATNMTAQDKVRAAIRRSGDRVRYWASLAAPANPLGESKLSLASKLSPATFEYLMEISVGTPPVTVLGAPDTGSGLVWAKCTGKSFNPRGSSSYRHLRCDSRACAALHRAASCGRRNSCQYDISYGDGSTSSGVLSRDAFSFSSTDGRKISFPGVVFGCTTKMSGTVDTGIIGLGKGPLSLISQLHRAVGGKFSYCLVPITESRSSSFFKLGAAAEVTSAGAVTTPIVSPDTPFASSFYHLSLREISVGSLRIPAEMDIIIDSGTAITMLPDTVVGPLTAELTEQIHAPQVTDPEGQFELCFRVGSSPGATAAFPEIVFEFGGGKVVLKPENTFVPSENGVSCLAITTSPIPSFAIFGFLAQQNFHVGYDLDKGTVTMAPANCATLR